LHTFVVIVIVVVVVVLVVPVITLTWLLLCATEQQSFWWVTWYTKDWPWPGFLRLDYDLLSVSTAGLLRNNVPTLFYSSAVRSSQRTNAEFRTSGQIFLGVPYSLVSSVS
jgi:hypothetical protein